MFIFINLKILLLYFLTGKDESTKRTILFIFFSARVIIILIVIALIILLYLPPLQLNFRLFCIKIGFKGETFTSIKFILKSTLKLLSYALFVLT
jgi:uncharacterized membrane-anchored protein